MGVQVIGPITMDDVDVLLESLHSQVEHLSGTDASEQLTRVGVSSAKLNAYRVALVDRIKSSQVWRADDPNATPASFLRQEHVLDSREAQSELRAADSFGRFPELEKACREGKLSRDKMNLILSFGLRNPQREAALPEFMSIFIELAPRVTIGKLRKALEVWAEQIDPITIAADEDSAHDRRELYVHQLGDGVKLDGFFGKEQGLRLITALNGALDKQWRATNDPGGTGHSTVADKVVGSTAVQRADAFIEGIIGPVLESGLLPTSGGAPANICVIVPLTRLADPDRPVDRGQVKAQMVEGTSRLHSPTIRATNGPGEAIISTQLAVQLSCDATIQRVVLDPAGKPLDIGRRTRVIPEQIRTALIVRDGGCAFPHCDRPPGWTEGHHIQHWGQGGPTTLDNLILLCSRHHHQVHRDRIPIAADSTGIPRVRVQNQFRSRRRE